MWDDEIFLAVLANAEAGDTGAQLALARLYKTGNGPNGISVPVNHLKSIEWYELAADQGRREAQNELGLAYQNGTGVEKNMAKAVEWFQLAADNGDPFGQYNLARLYSIGAGVEKDPSQAFQLFLKSANQGHKWAQAAVADRYSNGEGIELDQNAATHWFTEAAENDNPDAAFYLYSRYLNGIGIKRDSAQAHAYLMRSAELGCKKSFPRLAKDFAEGINGADLDAEAAFHWSMKAAENGYVGSMFTVARGYLDGQNGSRNVDAAVRWLSHDALKDSGAAHYQLGLVYSQEQYGCVDLPKAILHLTRASELKCDLGQAEIALGDILVNAPETMGGAKVGFKWYQKAAALPYGSWDGMLRVAKCYELGIGVDREPYRAYEIVLKVAEYGLLEAQQKLAEFLERGVGVPRNYKEAYYWANLSAASGDEVAMTVRDRLERNLTRSQIADVQQATTQWKPVESE